MENDNWKNHTVTLHYNQVKFRPTLHVKDLSEKQQQEYYEFILSKKKEQEEYVDRFTYISNSDDTDQSAELLSVIRQQFEDRDDIAGVSNVTIDEWKWISSNGEITLKDIYWVGGSGRLMGMIFFIVDGKFVRACCNDGRHLLRFNGGTDLHREFNEQLASFNYIRARRIEYDPRNKHFLTS